MSLIPRYVELPGGNGKDWKSRPAVLSAAAMQRLFVFAPSTTTTPVLRGRFVFRA